MSDTTTLRSLVEENSKFIRRLEQLEAVLRASESRFVEVQAQLAFMQGKQLEILEMLTKQREEERLRKEERAVQPHPQGACCSGERQPASGAKTGLVSHGSPLEWLASWWRKRAASRF